LIDKQNNISGENNNTSRYLDDQHLSILFQDEEFLNELRHNKDFLTTLHSGLLSYSLIFIKQKNVYLDQSIRSTLSSQQRRSSHQLSTKPLPLPTPPTVEVPKTPKIRARMLQNVLTQIEQGQTMKSKQQTKFLIYQLILFFILASMVPEESITQNEGYSYGKGI
jgi:hypothetical protein